MISERFIFERSTLLGVDFTVGEIASFLDGQWTKAMEEGNQEQFFDDVEQWIQSTKFPDYLLMRRDIHLEKHQPSLFEAITETVRRLRFLEGLRKNLPAETEALIICGSMSYGRFFNIRGGDDPSDVDLILVINNESVVEREDDQPDGIFADFDGFLFEERALLNLRFSRFRRLYNENKAQVMSQKFSVENYEVGLTIIPFRDFQWEMIDLPEQLLRDRKDIEVSTLDYKPQPYSHREYKQANYLGDLYRYYASEEALPLGEVVTHIPACIVKDRRLITGLHENFVLPKLETLYDKGQIQFILDEYEQLLKRECLVEREMDPPGLESGVVNIMDRLQLFSPQTIVEARQRFH